MKTALVLGTLAGFLMNGQAPPRVETPPKTTGAVEGKVIDRVTHEPVRKVSVYLDPSDSKQGTSYVAESNADGLFRIEDVDPGEYHVAAERTGFELKVPGASGAPLPPVKVAVGETTKDLVVPLSPLAVITGRVIDEDGDPVRGANVRAMRYNYVHGKRDLQQAGQTQANDKGEYRMYGLRPGSYYLQLTGGGQPAYFGPARIAIRGTPAPRGYSPTYYPNSPDIGHATPVDVRAGALVTEIDIRLQRQVQFSVRGKLPEESDPRRSRFFVRILPRDSDGNTSPGREMPGSFEFQGLVPGSYMLLGTQASGDQRTYASLPVEIFNQDVDAGMLQFKPAASVSGTVRVAAGAALPSGVHVTLQPDGPTIFSFPSSDAKPDGSFVLKDVPPIVYTVNVSGIGRMYLKTIQVGDRKAENGKADFTQSTAPLAIVLGADTGIIEGHVKDAEGKPVARARVTVVPQGDHAVRTDLARFAFTDDDGAFSVKDVPPGDCKVFAWEDVEPGAPDDPAFRKRFERRGVGVVLKPGGKTKADLTVISVADLERPE